MRAGGSLIKLTGPDQRGAYALRVGFLPISFRRSSSR